ncbi:hypothetical protein FRC12_008352 [Ceratobasidium sp. 428]|nr:hypothetical protein FRC12_008352 [Ceratobasidium sp. 428]
MYAVYLRRIRTQGFHGKAYANTAVMLHVYRTDLVGTDDLYHYLQQRAGGPEGQRLYSELWSADKWWQLQNTLGLGQGAAIATVILSSDKTQLSVMCGNKKAWPVYITLGDIESSVRRRPSEHATVLLGYVPVTDLTGEDAWQFFHDCVEQMLRPLKEVGRAGVEMRCADGGVRLVFPLVVAYIADFPEQCLVACTPKSRCPKCLMPSDDRGEYNRQHPPRDQAKILSAMNLKGRERTRTMKTLGIRPPTQPFWRDLPFANISSALSPDLLHQLHKGVFGEHLTKWFTDAGLLGEKRFDHWLMGIPRAAGL